MQSTPNVLLVMCDQMKATASHLYGSTFCTTPNLERLASEGVRYEHAFTPHPLCVPARVALWTARYPHTTGARRNETPMPATERHAFHIWKERGFETALIGKNHCFELEADRALFDVYAECTHGSVVRRTRGREWVVPPDDLETAFAARRNMPAASSRFSYAVTDGPPEHHNTAALTAQAIDFLEHRNPDRPFAMWLSYPDPHSPYEVPRRYYEQLDPDRVEMPPWREGEMNDAPEANQVLHRILGVRDDSREALRELITVYHAMVLAIDEGVGRVLGALERLDLADDTIVVFCSDHGDFADEHAMVSKGGLFYDCLTRVPLIVRAPYTGVTGVVDTSMVNLIDIVPTLLALQGIPVPAAMQGAPLPSLTDAAPRDFTVSEYGAGGPPFQHEDLDRLDPQTGRTALMASLREREAEGFRKMIRTAEWKLVHDPDGRGDELYDLRADPWELTNLAAVPEYAARRSELLEMLCDWSLHHENPLPVPLP